MIFRKPFTQILLPSVFSVTISATLISLSGCSFATNEHVKSNKKKPNFVWLISEDNSHHYLAHFFAGGAKTPAIEKLAREGITYTNAYSNAPVCSVARTTLQTGIYAPKIGAQFHRPFSTVSRPSKTKMIHEYLRDSGYYVTNKSKTDYNINVKARRTWDDSTKKSSWKNRKHPDQPFFHMETIFLSHESSLHFDDEYYQKNKDEVNLDLATLPPYLPDTPINRFTHLHYLSKLEQVDAKIATIVDSLKTDGVLEDTFIFYFADHGGVLPRGKGYLYESGLHVPLVVRIPENFKHLFPSDSGSTLTGTVEFVDFTPTLLKLAALPVPDFLDGEAFLGSGISAKHFNKRQESFGYADRFDEKYDLVRSLKVGRFHYIRSYQPYLPDGLFNSYRYKMLSYREWSRLNKSTHLPSVQRTFFNAKPVEMLFDTDVDPHEVNNLATNPKYLSTLKDLRTRLEAKLIQLPDLGFLPESYLAEKNIDRPLEFSIASQVFNYRTGRDCKLAATSIWRGKK